MIHGMKDQQTLDIGEYKIQVEERLTAWKKENFNHRLWAKDPTLWFPKPEPEITDRLGWLTLPEMMHEKLDDLVSFAEEVKSEGISHVALLGMGGSSLAPEVFQKTFGNSPGHPELLVLDSTHPEAVRALEERVDLRCTLFLVSSKSGTTLETLSLFRYFWNKMSQVVDKSGRHFVAITDPGTPLMKMAQERGFRTVFEAPPDVGGRYSAFTVFGLTPAALIGMDVHKFLDKAWLASGNNAFCVSEENVSGLILGAALGELSAIRNKLTILTSPSLCSFCDWLEQLIAESTGKDGKGIIPVVNEPIAPFDVYGEDRFFVGLFFKGDQKDELEEQFMKLKASRHPTIRINLKEKLDLGQEIFRWEIAIASSGAILGIHPFNQPDVQLAKDFAWKAMEEEESKEKDKSQMEAVSTEEPEILAEALEKWIQQSKRGDYIALQAYLSPSPDITVALQKVRFELFRRTHLATTMGYGPRFLHSTGQLHKGGPANGLFLQLIDEPKEDLPIPETNYSFRALIQAQALGDYHALKQRNRRVVRVNLKDDVNEGLKCIEEIFHA